MAHKIYLVFSSWLRCLDLLISPGDPVDGQLANDNIPAGGQGRQHRVPQSALGIVVLHSHHAAATGGRILLHGRQIQRLHRERVHHTNVDTLVENIYIQKVREVKLSRKVNDPRKKFQIVNKSKMVKEKNSKFSIKVKVKEKNSKFSTKKIQNF